MEQWAGPLAGGCPKRNVMPRVKSISTSQGSKPDAQNEPVAGFSGEHDSASGRKLSSSRVPLPKPIQQHVSQLASDFRQVHGLQDRSTGDRIARLFRSGITPRRSAGRPASPEVLKAVELRRKKTPWSRVFPQVISGYWDLPYEKKYYRGDKLRRAVAAHLRRRRTKQSQS